MQRFINAQIENVIFGEIGGTKDYGILLQVLTSDNQRLNLGGFSVANEEEDVPFGSKYIANLFKITKSREFKEIYGKVIRLILEKEGEDENTPEKIIGIKNAITEDEIIFEDYAPNESLKNKTTGTVGVAC